jgi:hypothetical protein
MVDLPLNGPGCQSRLRLAQHLGEHGGVEGGAPARGAIATKAGVRLVDADRKRVSITACCRQHF